MISFFFFFSFSREFNRSSWWKCTMSYDIFFFAFSLSLEKYFGILGMMDRSIFQCAKEERTHTHQEIWKHLGETWYFYEKEREREREKGKYWWNLFVQRLVVDFVICLWRIYGVYYLAEERFRDESCRVLTLSSFLFSLRTIHKSNKSHVFWEIDSRDLYFLSNTFNT